MKTEFNVLLFFAVHSQMSVREARTNLRVLFKIVHRILMKHKWKSFHYSPTHHLEKDDFHRRLEFCKWFMLRTQEDNNFPTYVIWTDESKFSKNSMYNRCNSHIWSDENPQKTRDMHFKDS